MATDKYPQRNINYPFSQKAIEMVRARLTPKQNPSINVAAPAGGKGSLREVRPGEWLDDRVIVIGAAPPPTDEGRWEELERREQQRGAKAVPSSFDSGKVYAVQLAKPVFQDGEWLKPSISYEMVGAVCTAISASIQSAEDLGEIPHEPYIDPQAGKK